jgi:hypothetical protein
MNSNSSALSLKISVPSPRFHPPTEMIHWKNAVGLPKNLRQRKTPAIFAEIVDDFDERLTSRGRSHPPSRWENPGSSEINKKFL